MFDGSRWDVCHPELVEGRGFDSSWRHLKVLYQRQVHTAGVVSDEASEAPTLCAWRCDR